MRGTPQFKEGKRFAMLAAIAESTAEGKSTAIVCASETNAKSIYEWLVSMLPDWIPLPRLIVPGQEPRTGSHEHHNKVLEELGVFEDERQGLRDLPPECRF